MANREGFWRVRYGAASGGGFALLVFDTGEIYGCDVAGGRYTGSYTVDNKTDEMHIQARCYALETMILVQGQRVPAGTEFEIRGTLPRAGGADRAIQVETGFGPAAAIFTKLHDLPG